MNPEQNKQRIEDAYQMFFRKDIAALIDTFDENIELIFPSSKSIPFSGTYKGKQGVGEFFSKLGNAVDTLKMEVHQYIAEGDLVAALGHTERRAKSSGVSYATEWVHVFTMRDGKATRFVIYDNTEVIANAMRGTTT